jgi:hypothetical protein
MSKKKKDAQSDGITFDDVSPEQRSEDLTKLVSDSAEHGVKTAADLADNDQEAINMMAHDENINVPETIPGHPEITVKPRPGHPEDPDLSSVKDDPQAAKSIVDACDDQGETLRSIDLESEVIACCDKYNDLIFVPKGEEIKIEDHEAVLNELVNLSNRYVGQVNVADNTIQGIICKYRIRLGRMFVAQQNIIEQFTDKLWKDYIDENYDKRQLRSIQVYMRIARIPDSIGYAGLGLQRLLQISSLIEDRISKKTGLYIDEKPITRFLSTHNCSYNPQEEADIAEMKRQTDITVGHEFIKSNGYGDYVSRSMVEALVNSKLDTGKDLVNRLSALKTLYGDNSDTLKEKIAQYIEKSIGDRKLEKVSTPDSEAKSLEATVKNLLKKAKDNMNKPEVHQRLDSQSISDLLAKLQELASKVPVSSAESTE